MRLPACEESEVQTPSAFKGFGGDSDVGWDVGTATWAGMRGR